jgi:hypothetical protein
MTISNSLSKFINDTASRKDEPGFTGFLARYIKLAVYFAYKTNHRTTLDIDDLVCSGIHGIYDAYRKFNPDRGMSEAAYVYQYIRSHVYTVAQKNTFFCVSNQYLAGFCIWAYCSMKSIIFRNGISDDVVRDSLVYDFDSPYVSLIAPEFIDVFTNLKTVVKCKCVNSSISYSTAMRRFTFGMELNNNCDTIEDAEKTHSLAVRSDISLIERIDIIRFMERLNDFDGFLFGLYLMGNNNQEIANKVVESGLRSTYTRQAVRGKMKGILHKLRRFLGPNYYDK